MKITKFIFNFFQENTYLCCFENNNCMVIDPGMSTKEEFQIFDNFISQNNLNITKVLITHLHLDHYLGLFFLKLKYSFETYFSYEDNYLNQFSSEMSDLYNFNYIEPKGNNLKENEVIEFENEIIKIIETPGHTKGHLVYFFKNSKILFTGDLLFKNSIGRSDLPGGNYDQIISSIKSKIFSLKEETIIFPGHGESTSIYDEKRNNPYLK